MKPILLTMGDPCGVGPEIIAQAFARKQAQGCIVVGDAAHIARAGVPWQVQTVAYSQLPTLEEISALPQHVIPVWNVVHLPADLPWGQCNELSGRTSFTCVQAALEQRHNMRALVTAPINKEAWNLAGIDYPGHTEVLQAASPTTPVRMMLVNEELRVVLVSVHLALRHAIEQLNRQAIAQTILITHQALRQMLPQPPRIAVAGLNPHAGEGGLFGHEDRDIIAPAVQDAVAEGILASGPYPADSVFMRARKGEFDVVVAMYHDQGLIPVKYLGIDAGVNTTIGLPFVRTSPDHGTAFDIAGLGQADPSSLISAVEVAKRLTGNPANTTESANTF